MFDVHFFHLRLFLEKRLDNLTRFFEGSKVYTHDLLFGFYADLDGLRCGHDITGGKIFFVDLCNILSGFYISKYVSPLLIGKRFLNFFSVFQQDDSDG